MFDERSCTPGGPEAITTFAPASRVRSPSSSIGATGVIEAPHGAHFTSCAPDYGRDEDEQRAYATTPWPQFAARYLADGGTP